MKKGLLRNTHLKVDQKKTFQMMPMHTFKEKKGYEYIKSVKIMFFFFLFFFLYIATKDFLPEKIYVLDKSTKIQR